MGRQAPAGLRAQHPPRLLRPGEHPAPPSGLLHARAWLRWRGVQTGEQIKVARRTRRSSTSGRSPTSASGCAACAASTATRRRSGSPTDRAPAARRQDCSQSRSRRKCSDRICSRLLPTKSPSEKLTSSLYKRTASPSVPSLQRTTARRLGERAGRQVLEPQHLFDDRVVRVHRCRAYLRPPPSLLNSRLAVSIRRRAGGGRANVTAPVRAPQTIGGLAAHGRRHRPDPQAESQTVRNWIDRVPACDPDQAATSGSRAPSSTG